MFLFPISFTSLQLDKKRVERGSSRARHIPQMLQRSFRFTRHRRCTYYRQCGSCTLCSQVWDVQMTIVFVSVHIRFFFFRSYSFTVSPDHFFYIHDVKYTIKIVTKDTIFSGNGKKKYYTFFLSCFFLRLPILMLMVYMHFGNVWLSDKRRPFYIVFPPIIVDRWYILIGYPVLQ